MIREELLSLPEFKPIFINFMTLIQLLVFAAIAIQSLTKNEFAKCVTLPPLCFYTMLVMPVLTLENNGSLSCFCSLRILLLHLRLHVKSSRMVCFTIARCRRWGMNPYGDTCSDDSCPLSANDTVITGVQPTELINPWLGPTSEYLIKQNSKFSPCMRDDVEIQRYVHQCAVCTQPACMHVVP